MALGAAGMAAFAAQSAAPPAYYVGNVQEVKDPEAYNALVGLGVVAASKAPESLDWLIGPDHAVTLPGWLTAVVARVSPPAWRA